MAFACSSVRFSARSTATPICARSLAMVETSRSCGTLVSASGFEESSAAHMIGSAAFFAPETRTSPSSGRPPVIFSLSIETFYPPAVLPTNSVFFIPFLGRQRLHGERVNFFTHAIAERPIHQLVALDAAFAGELAGDHDGLEMLAVADHFHVLAGETVFDALFNAFGGNHLGPQLVTGFEQQKAGH